MRLNPRVCACGCGETFVPKSKRQKFAARKCSVRASRNKRRSEKQLPVHATLTPAMVQFRSLQESEDDYFREVLQDAVRDQVTTYVQDNILGAAEIITNLLPKALASLADDLENGDEYLRAKARDTLFKYALEFKKRDAVEPGFGQINVFTALPLPDTPLGVATAHEIITIDENREAEQIEAFEQDWPECSKCHVRKHPDSLHTERTGNGAQTRLYCTACRMRKRRRDARTRNGFPLREDSGS